MTDDAYRQLMKHAHRLAMDGHGELAQFLRDALNDASPECFVCASPKYGKYVEMTAAPQDELPPPFDYCYEWETYSGARHRSFSPAPYNGSEPTRTVVLYTADQARAARAPLLEQIEALGCLLSEWEEDWREPRERAEKAEAEIERLKAGGCARDQGLTQYCVEAVALQARLAAAEALLKEARLYVDYYDVHVGSRRELLERIDAFLSNAPDA